MTYQRTLLVSLFLLLITSFGLASCDGGPPEEVVYEVTLLPSLGGTSSGGNAINDRGWVAGGSNHPGNELIEAALWKGESLIELGALGGDGVHSFVGWPGINNRGMVVGISETDEMDSNGDGTNFSCHFFFPGDHTGRVCRGFFWEDGEMIAMPTLGGEDSKNSFATSVNSRGQVAGWAETDIDDPTCNTSFQTKQFRAVMWEPRRDRITELPPLPDDSTSAATSINNKGEAAGISGECGIAVGSVSAQHMVFWEDGEPTEIEHLGGVDWHTPMAMNERGVVVGFSNPPDVTDGSFNPEGFIWTKHNGTDSLGTLSGDISSQALGINERGQVVGLSRDAESNDTAVIWPEGTRASLQNLNDLTPDFEGHLVYANDVNNRGVITGGAIDPETGDRVAFRATPTRRNR